MSYLNIDEFLISGQNLSDTLIPCMDKERHEKVEFLRILDQSYEELANLLKPFVTINRTTLELDITKL